MDKNMAELASFFRERDNEPHSGIQIGEVVTDFPNIQIRLSDEILLEKDDLIFSSDTLANFQRQYETNNGQNGTITFKDSFVFGDEVILMPTQNEQLYFVLGKAVRL